MTADPGWHGDEYVPCPECGWEPPVERNPAPGVPVRLGFVIHYGDCPTVPHLSADDERALRARIEEMDRVRRRGEAESRFYVIG